MITVLTRGNNSNKNGLFTDYRTKKPSTITENRYIFFSFGTGPQRVKIVVEWMDYLSSLKKRYYTITNGQTAI